MQTLPGGTDLAFDKSTQRFFWWWIKHIVLQQPGVNFPLVSWWISIWKLHQNRRRSDDDSQRPPFREEFLKWPQRASQNSSSASFA